MTVAEIDARHAELIADLRRRIRAILESVGTPMGLSTIEAYLKKEEIDSCGVPDHENTFDVRDAVSELIEAEEAEYTIGRQVRLRKK